MILELPNKWDSNEWAILIFLLISFIIIVCLPKRFPKSVTLLMLMFGLIVAKTLDHILGIPPYDLYDTNDLKKYEFSDVFLYILYMPFSYIFFYSYDYLKLRGGLLISFLLSWAVFAVFFEWISLKLKIIHYGAWKLFYSFPIYLLVLCFSLLFYHLLKWKFLKTRKDEGEWQ
jgi:hypothetical protein